MSGDRHIPLGRIMGAHGVKGDVLVQTYTGNARNIASYGPLGDEEGRRTFDLSVRCVTAKGVVAHVSGIDNRDAAEALKGTVLCVPRKRLPDPEEGAYYHADLEGLAAVDGEGQPVGTIAAVRNYGAGDLLEIELRSSKQTELVPFTAAFVPDVDLGRRCVVVLLPRSGGEDSSEPGGRS